MAALNGTLKDNTQVQIQLGRLAWLLGAGVFAVLGILLGQQLSIVRLNDRADVAEHHCKMDKITDAADVMYVIRQGNHKHEKVSKKQ